MMVQSKHFRAGMSALMSETVLMDDISQSPGPLDWAGRVRLVAPPCNMDCAGTQKPRGCGWKVLV